MSRRAQALRGSEGSREARDLEGHGARRPRHLAWRLCPPASLCRRSCPTAAAERCTHPTGLASSPLPPLLLQLLLRIGRREGCRSRAAQLLPLAVRQEPGGRGGCRAVPGAAGVVVRETERH